MKFGFCSEAMNKTEPARRVCAPVLEEEAYCKPLFESKAIGYTKYSFRWIALCPRFLF